MKPLLSFLKGDDGTLQLTTIVGLNVLVGLSSQFLILGYLGIGNAADALVTAQALPALVLAVFGTALGKQLIPFFKTHGEDGGSVMSVALYAVVLVLGLTLLLIATSSWWLRLLFVGMESGALEQVFPLSNIVLLSLVPGMLALVLTGYWQSRHSFLRVELAVLAASVCGLVLLVPAIAQAGAAGAAAVILMKGGLQAALLLFGLGNYRPGRLSAAARRMLLDGLRPALSAATIFKLGPLADRVLAAHVGPGAISLLNFLQQIYGTLLMVADRILSPRAIAKVADAVNDEARHRVVQWHMVVLARLVMMAIVVALILVGLLPVLVDTFSRDIVVLDIRSLAGMFIFFLVGGLVGQQSASILYGANMSHAVFRIALGGFVVSMTARVVGLYFYGFYGLVFGIVLYQVLNAVFLYRYSQRYIFKKEALA